MSPVRQFPTPLLRFQAIMDFIFSSMRPWEDVSDVSSVIRREVSSDYCFRRSDSVNSISDNWSKTALDSFGSFFQRSLTVQVTSPGCLRILIFRPSSIHLLG